MEPGLASYAFLHKARFRQAFSMAFTQRQSMSILGLGSFAQASASLRQRWIGYADREATEDFLALEMAARDYP